MRNALVVVCALLFVVGCQGRRCTKAKESLALGWELYASSLDRHTADIDALQKRMSTTSLSQSADANDPDRKLAADLPAALTSHVTTMKAAIAAARQVSKDGTGKSARDASKRAFEAATAFHTAELRSVEVRRADTRATVKTVNAVADYLGKSKEPGIEKQVVDTKADYAKNLAEAEKEFDRERDESNDTYATAKRVDAEAETTATTCGDL